MTKAETLNLIEELKTDNVWNFECTFKAAARAINRLPDYATMPKVDVFEYQCRLTWEEGDYFLEIMHLNTDQLKLTTRNLDKDYSTDVLQIGMFLPQWLVDVIVFNFTSVP